MKEEKNVNELEQKEPAEKENLASTSENQTSESKEENQDKVDEASTEEVEASREQRPIVIEVKDRKINVNTLEISMSRRFRLGMLCNFLCLAGLSALTTYLVMAKAFPCAPWIIGVGGGFLTFCSICHAIIKLHDWAYTMNSMNQQMGEWAMEDVIAICRDFIAAGIQYAAEEVQKVKGEKGQESAPAEQKA